MFLLHSCGNLTLQAAKSAHFSCICQKKVVTLQPIWRKVVKTTNRYTNKNETFKSESAPPDDGVGSNVDDDIQLL